MSAAIAKRCFPAKVMPSGNGINNTIEKITNPPINAINLRLNKDSDIDNLNTNLKDFTAIYEEINMVFNLTIVRLNKSGISTVVHDHPEEVIHDKIRDVFRRAA